MKSHLMIDKGTAHESDESDESVHVLRSRMNNLSGRKKKMCKIRFYLHFWKYAQKCGWVF